MKSAMLDGHHDLHRIFNMLKRREKPKELTLEQIEELKFKDFMGELTLSEVRIARAKRILEWDLFVKCQKLEMYRNEISRLCEKKGVSPFDLAPRLKADGTIRDSEKKYLITNHAEFEKLLERLNSMS